MESSNKSKFTYSEARTHKNKEKGFSNEMISADSKFLLEKGATMDTLHALPFEGVDTLYKAIKRNVSRIPNNDIMGTLNGDHYEWMTFKDMATVSEMLSHGIMALGLAPEVEAEGKKWRFMGVQSKNRKEWILTNIAGCY